MAPSIYRFAERRTHGAAWHSMGTVITEEILPSEAARQYDMVYPIVTQPTYYKSPSDGHLVETDRVAIVRPEWNGEAEALYGYASGGYTPISNLDVAVLVDRIVHDASWKLETIGVIRNGADFFVTLDAGTTRINGDEVQVYFFVWNSHDGTSSLRVRITPVRVVCQNTCILGDARSIIAADVRHTRRVMEEAEFTFDLVRQLKGARERAIALFGDMGKIQLSVDDITRIVETTYPQNEPGRQLVTLAAHPDSELTDEQKTKLLQLKVNLETQHAQALQMRAAFWDSLNQFNEERSKYALTGWAVYQAAADLETWRKGGSAPTWAQSVVLGQRAATIAKVSELVLAAR